MADNPRVRSLSARFAGILHMNVGGKGAVWMGGDKILPKFDQGQQ